MQTHSNSLARLRTMFPSRHVRTTQVFPCTSSCCDSVGGTSLTTTHKKHMQKHDLPADFLTPKLVWELRFWNHGEWNQLQIKPVKHGCYYRILQVLRMGSTLIINSWRTIPASHPTWSSQHIVVIHINLSDWKKLETTDFIPWFLYSSKNKNKDMLVWQSYDMMIHDVFWDAALRRHGIISHRSTLENSPWPRGLSSEGRTWRRKLIR